MMEANCVATILHAIQENILNTEIVMSAINALDAICRHRVAIPYFVDGNGIPIVIRVLKAHDYNTELVLMCLNIFSSVANIKQY